MIAHTGEDPGIGFDTRQLADAGIQGIAVAADQVAGDHGEVGVQLKGGIDHTGEFGLTKKRAEVNVAELEDAQAIEIVRQAGQRDIDLADSKIGALDECTVAHRGKGRRHERAARGVEHAAAAGVYVRMQELTHAGKQLVNHQYAGQRHEIGERTGAQYAADACGDAQPCQQRGERECVTDRQEGGEHEECGAYPAARGGGQQEPADPPLRQGEDYDEDDIQLIVCHACSIFSR